MSISLKSEDRAALIHPMSYRNDPLTVHYLGEIEKHLGILPECLKNILFFNGYANFLTLSQIREQNINVMAHVVRTTMARLCPHTMEFFHVFYRNPSEFAFPRGYLMLIELIKTLAVKIITHQNNLVVLRQVKSTTPRKADDNGTGLEFENPEGTE